MINETGLSLQEVQGITGWVACWSASDRGPHSSSNFDLLYTNERAKPAISKSDTCAILFDGALQNRDEVLHQLDRNSERDLSDAEVLLYSYSRWGEGFLEKIKGVFLLAVWDKKRNSLLCVRDRCGIYPFFYAQVGDQVFFSISPEDLVRHPKVSSRVNRMAVVDYLCHRRPVPEETYFENVKRVLPGFTVRFTNGNQQSMRYWSCFPPDGEVDYITELSDSGFDTVMDQAVKRCMVLGPSAIFLSGGLDSVSIASVAADLASREGYRAPQALSLGFPHPECNEIDRQRGVADGLGLDLFLKPVNDIVAEQGLFWSALELSKEWSQPMWNFWQPLYMHLARQGKHLGCDVIMTGGGGDEWLNVNPEYVADLMRALDFRGVKRFVANVSRSYRLPRLHFLRWLLWTCGIRPLLGLYAGQFARATTPGLLRTYMRKRFSKTAPAWIAPDPELKRQVDERIEQMVEQFMTRPEPRGRHGFYSRSFFQHFVNTITSMELELQFEAGQKTGTLILQPYYDADLIHLLLRMSPELLQKGGMEKGVVREAVARRFPGLKFERQKKVSAMVYWQSIVRGEGPEVWRRMGGVPTLVESGIVDQSKIRPVAEEAFISNSPWKNYPVWDILCTEAWLRSRVS